MRRVSVLLADRGVDCSLYSGYLSRLRNIRSRLSNIRIRSFCLRFAVNFEIRGFIAGSFAAGGLGRKNRANRYFVPVNGIGET